MNKRIMKTVTAILMLVLAFGPTLSLAAPRKDSGKIKKSIPPALATKKRPVPKKRNHPFAAPVQTTAALPGQTVTLLRDGRSLLIGGEAANVPQNTVSISDLRTGEIRTTRNNLHRARAWHSATMLPDGRILILGGLGSNGAVVRNAEIFDPETQSFRLLPESRLNGRAYHSATLLTNGHVLITGGSTGEGPLRKTLLWDFRSEKFTAELAGPSIPRQQHKATLLHDGNVLIEGGIDSSGNPVTSSELYTIDGKGFVISSISSDQADPLEPFMAGSLPADGAFDVPVNTIIGVRFSRRLRVETINSDSLKLMGPEGTVETRVVPAEAGKLAFLSPVASLLPGVAYTVSISGAVDEGDKEIAPGAITFTTKRERGVEGPDNEDWIPDETNFRGDWRSKFKESSWQSLPPLQAEPGVTALSGQVLALNGMPLSNVTLRIAGKTTTTDNTGRFLLQSIPTGHRVLMIDGRTASRNQKIYGIFKIGVDVIEGKTTPLGYTVWMPKLDMAHAVQIASPTQSETVITSPKIPGLELRLPSGTLIRSIDGAAVREISITAIPTNQPPFPLPSGVHVPVFFTIQPGGAYVIPPRARLIYPNFTNSEPGTRIDFWNYDATEKGWYVYGKGTVTADGRQIVPDPGVVLYEFSGAMVSLPSNAPDEGPPDCNDCDEDGEPVNLPTGLFVQSKTDLVLPDTLPIVLTRTYRPRDSIVRSFGRGTSHPYEIFLVGSTRPWTYIDLILPDGGRIHYDRISSGTQFFDGIFEHTATPGVFYKSQIRWGQSFEVSFLGWGLTLKDGTFMRFPDSDSRIGPRWASVESIKDRYGNEIKLAQDSNSNLTRITSPNGYWIEFTYDANKITQAKDNIGRVVNYEYDIDARLSKVTDANGGITEYTYDGSHRMTSIKDARGIVYLTNEYDINGRVIKQTQADNSTYEFAYTLDSNSKVTQTDVTDPRGNVRRVTFNSSGYVMTDTYAVGEPEEQTITYERQAGSNHILSVTDSLGRKAAYTYDTKGNLTSVTRLAGTPEAVTANFTYESAFNQVTSATDPLNHSASFAYDAKGNIISVTDPLNRQATFTYNAAGLPLSATDPLQNTTQFSHEFGFLSRLTDPEGRTASRFMDDGGRMVKVTNPLGQTTRYEYDPLNQPKKVIDPLGSFTSFSYDPNGNLLSVTDARGNVTSYAYDQMDRLTTRTDALLRSENYEYDADGNLIKFTDRRGKATIYEYDPLDRLTFAGFGAVTEGETTSYESTITYTYDVGSRLTKVEDSVSGTINLAYDNLDRLTSENTPQGTVSYAYDAAGRRTSMTVAGQPAVVYTYDNADRLTGITQGAATVGFSFDDADRLTALTLPNGVRVEYAYDRASQLTGIIYKNGEVVIGDLTYQHDQVGRRTRVGGSFARTGLPQSFVSATHNAANQLTQKGAATLTYDANGNLTSDGINTYTWDVRNQLTSIGGAATASFQYDAFGRRIGKTVSGVSTNYLYDGANVVQELNGTTPTANLLNGGIDQLFSRTDGSGTQIPLADGLGSILGLTNGSGAIQTEYTYDPFGNTTTSGALSSNPSQYTGREQDGTGLYYYRARYYNPTLQRFISEDPIGFAGGDVNFYAYVGNSPIDFIDSSGMQIRVDRDRPGDKEWAEELREQMANWNAPPVSGRKDCEGDSSAGMSPLVVAAVMAGADGPEPFVGDAAALVFLCVVYLTATNASRTDTTGRVLEFPTGTVLQPGQRVPKTWRVPPPPQPPSRQKRCADAAFRCGVALTGDSERLKLCDLALQTCLKTNLTVKFPHGEVVR